VPRCLEACSGCGFLSGAATALGETVPARRGGGRARPAGGAAGSWWAVRGHGAAGSSVPVLDGRGRGLGRGGWMSVTKEGIIAKALSTPEGRQELARAMWPYACDVCGRFPMNWKGLGVRPVETCPACGAVWFDAERKWVPDGDVGASDEVSGAWWSEKRRCDVIIGENFAWGHIPRTGGTLTACRFVEAARLCGAALSVDGDLSHSKHDPFPARAVEGKVLVLSVRRLPSLYLSWLVMMSGRLRPGDPVCGDYGGGVWPCYVPLPTPTRGQVLGVEDYRVRDFVDVYGPLRCFPDAYLRSFTDDGRLKVDHHIRLEFLDRDFRRVAVALGMDYDEDAFRPVAPGAKVVFSYDHDVAGYFSEGDLEVLYANNPLWAAMEAEVYGGVPG